MLSLLKCVSQTSGAKCTRGRFSLLRCPHPDLHLSPFDVIRCCYLCQSTQLMLQVFAAGARSKTRPTLCLQASLLACCSATANTTTFSAKFSASSVCYSCHCTHCTATCDSQRKGSDKSDGELLSLSLLMLGASHPCRPAKAALSCLCLTSQNRSQFGCWCAVQMEGA